MILVKCLGIGLCLLDIFYLLQVPNSSHISNYSPAKEIKTLIAKQKNELLVQLLILISTFLSLILTEKKLSCSSFIFVFMLLNIKKYQEDSLKKLESQFFIATLYEKYWDIVKMMAMNILVCHLLACVLIWTTHF